MKSLKKMWNSVKGQLPTAYFSGLPDIRIVGMREVYIEAHRGLLSYSEEEILLKASERAISVTGSGLTLCGMTMHEAHISGLIRSVNLVD